VVQANVGLTATETPRDVAFVHMPLEASMFRDSGRAEDDRFVHNPLVTDGPKIRFYAGAPLITSEGQALGTLCVIDYVPRQISLEQSNALQILSRLSWRSWNYAGDSANLRAGRATPTAVTALRHAIDAGEFLLHYQPKWTCAADGSSGSKHLSAGTGPAMDSSPRELYSAAGGIRLDSGSRRLGTASVAADYREWLQKGLNAPELPSTSRLCS